MEIDPFLALDNVPPMPPVIEEETTSSIGGSAHEEATSLVESTNDTDAEDPLSLVLGTSKNNAVASSNDGGSSAISTAPVKKSNAPMKVSSINSANKTSAGKPRNTTPEDLNEELATLLLKKQLPQTSVTALQNLLRENASLKEKNNKLKSLLGRSAKAQRDAKNELEQMKKLYEGTKDDNDRLEKRVEVLANRPTHMDLLADFETNFDRALLSIGGNENKKSASQQSGGENAAEASSSSPVGADANDGISLYDDHVTTPSLSSASSRAHGRSSIGNDSLLLTELNEAKSRIVHLESLNTSFQGRFNNLEHSRRTLFNEQQSSKNTLTNVQLELRMSRMETEHAMRSLREKEAIVSEMQLEINLVTQSAVDARKRAAEGMEVMQSVKSDREYVDGLEAKVVALQEWALASTESKQLTMERCRGLEGRVKELGEVIKKLTSRGDDGLLLDPDAFSGEGLLADLNSGENIKRVSSCASSLASIGSQGHERKLWTQSSSLVVGAGMVGHTLFELSPGTHIEPYETVILRWKFDLTPGDLDIFFSVLKGICEDKKTQRGADACFRHRHVKGGVEGM